MAVWGEKYLFMVVKQLKTVRTEAQSGRQRDGKIETDDPRLFFSVSTLRGKDPQDAVMETHEKYIDIQTPIIGVESIGWKAGDELMIISQPYDAEKDQHMLFLPSQKITAVKIFFST